MLFFNALDKYFVTRCHGDRRALFSQKWSCKCHLLCQIDTKCNVTVFGKFENNDTAPMVGYLIDYQIVIQIKNKIHFMICCRYFVLVVTVCCTPKIIERLASTIKQHILTIATLLDKLQHFIAKVLRPEPIPLISQ